MRKQIFNGVVFLVLILTYHIIGKQCAVISPPHNARKAEIETDVAPTF